MLRLSSLLPIIKLAPILEHDPGRLPYAPPEAGKTGPARDGTEANAKVIPVEPATGRPAELYRGQPAEPATDRSATPDRQRGEIPAQRRFAQSEAQPGAERSPGQALPLAKSASYNSIGLPNPALTAAEPPPAGQPRLSATATLLVSLTQKTAPADVPAQIRSPSPLINGAPDRPVALAAALRDAISLSGLFYESHLEQWLNGSLPLEALKQEPQAALPAIAGFSPAESPTPATAQSQSVPAHEPMAWLQQNLVQQLSVLNNPALAWSGQVWPGQFVTVQTSREHARWVADEAPWVTRLSLEMPNLGKIEIQISLDSRGIDLDIQSEAASALNRMQAGQPDLGRQLADAGCSLRRMRIRSGHEAA
jgi:hypothetical protein